MRIVPIIFLMAFIVTQAPALAQQSLFYDRTDSEAFVGQDSARKLNAKKRDSVDYNDSLGSDSLARDVAEEEKRDKQGTVLDMGGKDVLFIDGRGFIGKDSPEELNKGKRDSVDYNDSL